jgi:hypothetical protein
VDHENESSLGSYLADGQVLRIMLEAMEKANPKSHSKLINTLATYFGAHSPTHGRPSALPSFAQDSQPALDDSKSFSSDRAPSPKEFMLAKAPQTDVDRIACLAYYLTHYREQDGFKTLDLSKLNAEAAQLKFSNPAYATDNATKLGFLIPHQKGQKKISALGEIYVQALPDRAAAKSAMAAARPRRKKARTVKA